MDGFVRRLTFTLIYVLLAIPCFGPGLLVRTPWMAVNLHSLRLIGDAYTHRGPLVNTTHALFLNSMAELIVLFGQTCFKVPLNGRVITPLRA